MLTVDQGLDDEGHPLEIGAMYSVYQTDDTPGGGHLAYWDGKGWLDADTLEEVDLGGEYACGFYEFARRQHTPKITLE